MPRRNDIQKTMIAVVAILVSISEANAQVDCFFKRLHVGRLRGIVSDQVGAPVSGAVVMLKRADQTIIRTKTDKNGQFAINSVSGNYDLGVEANGFARAWSPVGIGSDVQSLLHSDELRVMLLVGAAEDCALFTTSKREFEKRVIANNRRLKGSEENNATQK